MNTMMINARPINNVDVEVNERSPNPRNSIKDYASRREPQSCGGVPIYTGSGPFRSIIDAAIFTQSSSNWLSSVSLGTPSTQHHTTFKVLYFIILFNANTVEASYISVSSFRPACGAELAQTGRIITCCYHTHSR